MTRVGVKDLIRCILVEDAGARHFGAVDLTQGATAAVVAALFLARNLVRVKCHVEVIIEIAPCEDTQRKCQPFRRLKASISASGAPDTATNSAPSLLAAVWGEYSVIPRQVHARQRHQRGQACHQVQRFQRPQPRLRNSRISRRYCHDAYYNKIPLASLAHRWLCRFLLRYPSPCLTSYDFVILRKPYAQSISGAQSSPASWLEKTQRSRPHGGVHVDNI